MLMGVAFPVMPGWRWPAATDPVLPVRTRCSGCCGYLQPEPSRLGGGARAPPRCYLVHACVTIDALRWAVLRL